MKKLCIGLLLTTAVCMPALAQQKPSDMLKMPGAAPTKPLTPAEQVQRMVSYYVLSEGVNYQGVPVVKTTPTGFDVSVPGGTVKTDAKRVVPAFSFPMRESGMVGADKRYQIQLDKLGQIFPTLEETFRAQNVSYRAVRYVGQFIPQLSLMESQQVTFDGLLIPMDEKGTSMASAAQIQFVDKSAPLSADTFKQENTLSLKGVEIKHPLASASIRSFDLSILVPQVEKSRTPLTQLLKTPSVQEKMTLSDVKLTSSLAQPPMELSFDVNQSIDMEQDQKTLNVDIAFKTAILNIQGKGFEKLPTQIIADMSVSGFTLADVLAYSAAKQKMTDVDKLPDSPRRKTIKDAVQKEVDDSYNTLVDKMIVTVEDMSARSDAYAMMLKGTMMPKDKTFKGTFQVTNFDLLAPEPKKIDEAACKVLVDKMLTGEVQGPEFQVRYKAMCDEGRGILDALRPFAASAQKVKDAQGKDALLFSVDIKQGDFFINGQKMDDETLPSAEDMMVK